MTGISAVLYALGKLDAWLRAWRSGGVRQILVALLFTVPIQAIVVSVLYLIGRGVGSLLGVEAGGDELGASDWRILGAFAFVSTTLALLVEVIERRSRATQAASPTALTSPKSDFDPNALHLDPSPISVGTFFDGPHTSHYDYTTLERPRELPEAAREKAGHDCAQDFF